jgi:hypothetical protein
VPIFRDAGGTAPKHVSAVCLVRRQGSRSVSQYFPTATEYSAGDYVTVEWDFSQGDDEAWVRRHGEMQQAWSQSTYFAGQVIGRAADVKLARLELRPVNVRVRPNDRVPIRVIGYLTDGVGTWREDVTDRANPTIDDANVAVAPGPFVRGNNRGQAQLTAE